VEVLAAVYGVAGSLAVLLALMSRRLRQWPVSEPMAALSAGVVVGPQVLGLLVGACLSPPDPVLAASVVSGEDAERDLPSRLRQTLSIESGADDGLALPLVAVALTGVLAGQAVSDVVGRLEWEVLAGQAVSDVVGRLAWEVLAGVVIGAACGIGAGWALHKATANGDLAEGPGWCSRCCCPSRCSGRHGSPAPTASSPCSSPGWRTTVGSISWRTTVGSISRREESRTASTRP
jgi:NhaP-type Na+/H+ or K+/H+ antiporter